MVTAHLQYLNLVAQAGTQRMLARTVELLEELVEFAEDEAFGDGADPEDEEDDDEDEDAPVPVVESEEWQQSLKQFVQPSPDEIDDDVIDASTVPEGELDEHQGDSGEESEEVPDAAE